MRPKYGGKAKLFHTDTGSFEVYLKTDDIHAVIAKDVGTRFYTSN